MLIHNLEQHNFTLDNFEGPLDFLLYLIQRNEIDIYNISLQKITEQYKAYLKSRPELSVESGAEFVNLTASLLWIKSKMLLPKHDHEGDGEEVFDPEFAIIHHLIDYCRFKDVAKELSIRENKQCGYYSRGMDSLYEPARMPLGVEHLSLDDLMLVFQDVLQRASAEKGIIQGDVWQVSDKIKLIEKMLKTDDQIEISVLFLPECSRDEVIVTFLAILELMKLGEIKVGKLDDKVVILNPFTGT